jgi:hypothetical protein
MLTFIPFDAHNFARKLMVKMGQNRPSTDPSRFTSEKITESEVVRRVRRVLEGVYGVLTTQGGM